MENKENKKITKLINGIKYVGFVLMLIFLVFVIILSLGFAIILLDFERFEYKEDEDLRREWENEKER